MISQVFASFYWLEWNSYLDASLRNVRQIHFRKPGIHSTTHKSSFTSRMTSLFKAIESKRTRSAEQRNQPNLKANCQVNRLHCCSFICLAVAAASFAHTWVWPGRAALTVPFLMAAIQAFRPDSVENLAIRLWEDRGQPTTTATIRKLMMMDDGWWWWWWWWWLMISDD